MHLLQVCNVGNICGGTAACAWTLARAWPQVHHTVAFLSRPTDATRKAFAGCQLEHWPAVTRERLAAVDPYLLVLHNVSTNRMPTTSSVPTIQYLHSLIRPAPADLTLACSRWLADRYPPGVVDRVLYQSVPRPTSPPGGDTRPLRDRIVVGRLCTPVVRKWPEALVPFYAQLAAHHPSIDWEFVGCPESLQPRMREACRGQAAFHRASWSARSHLWRWDALLYHHPTLDESFGRTTAEAMRAGCIPIVDARGGFTEQVTTETGVLCSGLDDFGRALDRLCDPSFRRALSRSAGSHADDRFSLAGFGARFLELLRAI